jgi:hypothetical protein
MSNRKRSRRKLLPPQTRQPPLPMVLELFVRFVSDSDSRFFSL